jgi:hypothetical protein
MTMKKWFLALVLALTLMGPIPDVVRQIAPWVPGPGIARALTPEQGLEIARKVGAHNLGFILVDDDPNSSERLEHGINAYYSYLFGIHYIKLIGLNDFMTDQEQTIILLHEIGHFFQFSEDRVPDNIFEREMDADVYALEAACNVLGWRDAPAIYARAFLRLRSGDWVTYGGLTITQRIEWAQSMALSCQIPERG